MYDKQQLEALREALEEWKQSNLLKTLASRPERRDRFMTTSSETIERLYTPLDIADLDYLDDLGLPGEYPFTRGVHPTMHRGRLWTMRMFAGLVLPKKQINALSISWTRVKPDYRLHLISPH